jgi:hypothetical protein
MESASIILTSIGVFIAAIYYVLTLRIQRRNMRITLDIRRAQLLLPIYEEYKNPEWKKVFSDFMTLKWSDYDDWNEKYGPEKNPEDFRRRGMLGDYFECLVAFAKRGLIDVALVDDLISGYVIKHWEKMASIYVEYRKRYNSPVTGEHVEYLYNEVKKIYDREHQESKSSPP